MTTLPNPDVYLNHLPPSEAEQFETARNICLAVLGAVIWDILVYISDDIKIICRRPVHLVTVAFVSSRLFTLMFILLEVIAQTGPLDNCSGMITAVGVACFISIISTTFIFLQRLRAVYSNNRSVHVISILLWLGTVATMTTTFFATKSAHIPGTNYCAYSVMEPPLIAAGLIFLSFDVFVFLAISYKIASDHSSLDVGITWATAISGKTLPRLSRALLQGGQQYYLITICLHLPGAIFIASPLTPPIYKIMLTFPLTCLAGSMASRIFRSMRKHDLRLWDAAHGISRSSEIDFSPPSRFRPRSTMNPTSIPSSRGILSHSTECNITFPEKAVTSGPSSDEMHVKLTVVEE